MNHRTFVNTGDPVLKVNQGGQVIQAVFLRLVQVTDLDEGNVVAVALVVNIFQFLEDGLMSRTVLIV